MTALEETRRRFAEMARRIRMENSEPYFRGDDARINKIVASTLWTNFYAVTNSIYYTDEDL